MNRVPKPWYEKEEYCQLLPNDDSNDPCYQILPRLGAFEITTVVDNVCILFYSKMMSSMWPNYKALTNRISAFVKDLKEGMKGAALKEKYQTTGR